MTIALNAAKYFDWWHFWPDVSPSEQYCWLLVWIQKKSINKKYKVILQADYFVVIKVYWQRKVFIPYERIENLIWVSIHFWEKRWALIIYFNVQVSYKKHGNKYICYIQSFFAGISIWFLFLYNPKCSLSEFYFAYFKWTFRKYWYPSVLKDWQGMLNVLTLTFPGWKELWIHYIHCLLYRCRQDAILVHIAAIL